MYYSKEEQEILLLFFRVPQNCADWGFHKRRKCVIIMVQNRIFVPMGQYSPGIFINTR